MDVGFLGFQSNPAVADFHGIKDRLVFTVIVIVIVISAMFIFYFCPKLQDKHCRDHYDYHRENNIQYLSLTAVLF